MSEDLRPSLLASVIIVEYKKLSDEQRKKIEDSPKPIRDLCNLLIEKYGHEKVSRIYMQEGDVLERALQLVKENMKEL